MSPQMRRDLLAQGMIALAVCVGGWYVLVKPKVEALAKIEHTLAEHKAAATNAATQQSVEAIANRASTLKSRVAEVESFNKLASDSSRLYGLVMELAQNYDIKVHSLQPGASKQTSSESAITVTRINMNVEGSYENIAHFFDAVSDIDAFVRPVSIQLIASRSNNEKQWVDANAGFDVLSFKLADALSNLGGAANVQQ